VGEAAEEVVERIEEGAPLALHASHMLARLGLALHQPLEPPVIIHVLLVRGALAAWGSEILEGGAEAAGQRFGLELHNDASRRPIVRW
jgi:hypothetical protein